MKKRLITGLILAAILIPAFVIGDIFLNVVLMLLALGASYELFNMFNSKNNFGKRMYAFVIILSGVLYFAIQAYYDVTMAVRLDWTFMMMIFIVVISACMLVVIPDFSVDNMGQVLVSIFYPALGFGAIYGIRSAGIFNIGFLFMVTIFTDIFAYAVGMRFGKHRLAEHISPKKSIEGSVGGTVCALILTMVYLYVVKANTDFTSVLNIDINFLSALSLTILISIVGQVGDLVASKMKRNYGIKDFSDIFPGHGGILDRFDSAVFAGMVLMLISEFVGVL